MEYGKRQRNGRAERAHIIADDKARAEELLQLASDFGLQSQNISISQLTEQHCAPDIIILMDFCSVSDRADAEISKFSSYIKSHNVKLLLWTDMERLDRAYALLPADQCRFLVNASPAEALLTMAKVTRQGQMNQLQDTSRDNEYQELHKISDELASVAKLLAKIADKEDAPRGGIVSGGLADKPVSFRPAPPISPFAEDQPTKNSGHFSAGFIREIIRLRRLRDQFFEADLFADPAWDIMLDLMAAKIEGIQVSVSSLCIAAAVPPTTALRWITSMTEKGMLIRQHDPQDARRVFVELSDEVTGKIERYFKKARDAGRPII